LDKVTAELLRSLPSVGTFLTSAQGRELKALYGQGLFKLELRRLLAEIRANLLENCGREVPDQQKIAAMLRQKLDNWSAPVAGQITRTDGVLAPVLSSAAARVERLLCALSGCQAAVIVDSHVSALVLCINTLANGREVVISRGQLIEIDQGFRISEAIAEAGAILRPVGSTNKTHLHDYQEACCPESGAVLHVNATSCQLQGFTAAPDLSEIVELACGNKLPLIAYCDSGALVKPNQSGESGLKEQPLISELLDNGARLVCFRGDQLMAGPKSGIICGSQVTIEKIRGNPLISGLGAEQSVMSALEAVLVSLVNDHL
jgi:seryl-tRNA(Sec) selenium transferase